MKEYKTHASKSENLKEQRLMERAARLAGRLKDTEMVSSLKIESASVAAGWRKNLNDRQLSDSAELVRKDRER